MSYNVIKCPHCNAEFSEEALGKNGRCPNRDCNNKVKWEYQLPNDGTNGDDLYDDVCKENAIYRQIIDDILKALKKLE